MSEATEQAEHQVLGDRHPSAAGPLIAACGSATGCRSSASSSPRRPSVQMYAVTRRLGRPAQHGRRRAAPDLRAVGRRGGFDVIDRRKLLIVSSILAGRSTLGCFAQALMGLRSGWLLLALPHLAVGRTRSARRPGRRSSRGSCRPGLVPAANTLSYTATTVGGVLGPLAAGLIFGVATTSTGVTVAWSTRRCAG